MVVPPPHVSAHCPGTDAAGLRDYAYGSRTLSSDSNGVKAIIYYTLKSVCLPSDGFAGETLAIYPTTPNHGWAQVGWHRTQAGVNEMFCELQPTPDTTVAYLRTFSVSAASHTYQTSYASGVGWSCFLDGVVKYSHDGLGFTAGKGLASFGETNTTHSQLGRNSPDKLPYTTMRYRLASNATWNTWSPNVLWVDGPYGVDTAVGTFYDFTYVPH